jgi:2'-5' RNA ligase
VPGIGILIHVPEPFGQQLEQVRVDFEDPWAGTVPSHVTLVPPVEVTPECLEALDGSLADAAAQIAPYPIRLRGTGTFRPVSPVVFIAVSLGISCTELLAQRVRAAVGGVDLEFPYHPHVTIAQDLDDIRLDQAYEQLRDFECEFLVEEFSFYVHNDVTGWAAERDFVLGHG